MSIATDTVPTLGQYFFMKLAKASARRENAREASNHARPWFQMVIRLVFHLAGFASLTYGAFYWNPIAGFAVMGFSFFLMSFLLTSTRVETHRPTNHSWATGDRRG